MQLPALTWKPLTCLQSLPAPMAFLRHLEERNIWQAGQEAAAYWHTTIETHLFPTCGILTTSVVRWWRIWIILKTNWWLNPIQIMHILLHCNYSSHIHSHFGCLPASLKLLSFWWGKDKSWCLDTKIQAVKVTLSPQHSDLRAKRAFISSISPPLPPLVRLTSFLPLEELSSGWNVEETIWNYP